MGGSVQERSKLPGGRGGRGGRGGGCYIHHEGSQLFALQKAHERDAGVCPIESSFACKWCVQYIHTHILLNVVHEWA